MDIQKYVNEIANELAYDSTKRMDCPSCGGKHTFTVSTNMGQVLYYCYKAGCSVGGSVKVNMSIEQIRSAFNKSQMAETIFRFPEYIVDFKQGVLDNSEYKYIYENYCMHDVRENRAVFKIFNEEGLVIDAVGRSIGNRLPKWKRYGKSKIPFVAGVYNALTNKRNDTCVVVEDCISACVISEYGMAGVALLGTSLLHEHKEFLSHYKKVIVALDPDALKKNLQIAKELRGWVDKVKVLRITDDLKYKNEIDINNLKEMVWNYH